jgi:hypothetical protein
MPALIGLLISLIVLGLILSVLWGLILSVLWWIVTMIPVPPPFQVCLRVVFALICLLCILSLLFGGWSFPFAGFYHR